MSFNYFKLLPLSLALSLNLFAQDSFTLKQQGLDEAIKKIAYKAKMPYIVDGKLLKGKKSKAITNIEGIQNALNEVLKGTNLKAVIKKGTILIVKKEKSISQNEIKKQKHQKNNLGIVEIQGDWLGSASVKNIKVYSGTRTIIDSKSLNKIAAINIEDALRVVPGVQIQDETGTGVLPNISLRGLKPGRSAYLNALVNGIPAAIAPYSHSSFSLFPITMETLEKIDVVKGGAAVHYGPNNVGGVVNFITKPISYEHTTTLKNTTRIADNGHTLSDNYLRTGGYVNDDLGIQLQYNAINGKSFRDHSNTNVTNVIFDTEYYPNDNSQIKSSFQYYKAKADLPGALLPKAFDKDNSKSQRPYDKFDGRTTRASITYKLNPTTNTEFNWINFAHKSKRKFTWGWNTKGLGFTPTEENATRVADRSITVFGTEPRWTFEKNNHKVTLGTRYVNEDVDYLLDQTKFSDGVKNTLRDWKIKTHALAAYASDTISFMDKRLKVTPGLRFEKVHTDFGDNKSSNSSSHKKKDMNSFLPGLSIGYQALDSVFLFTNAQKSLRSPQVAQVRKDGDLSAELAWNYEIGMRYEPSEYFKVNTTLYRIDYKDQVEYVSSTQSFRNLGKTKHQGIETQFILKPTKNTLFTLAYTYLDTEQLSGTNKGKRLPWTSKHQLSLSSDYRLNDMFFNLTGIYLSKAFSDSANTKKESSDGQKGEVPSYVLWDAKVTKNLKIANYDTEFSFGVNNIFDEKYYFRGVDISPVGRVSGQGRTFLLSAKIDF